MVLETYCMRDVLVCGLSDSRADVLFASIGLLYLGY